MQLSFKKAITGYPAAFLLLPVFFVVHGWKENYYFIRPGDIYLLAGTYLLAAWLLFFISLFFLKNKIKAGLYTFFVLGVYFFFGAFQDFLKSYPVTAEISRYKILLPLLFLFLLVSFFWLKKTRRDLSKLNSFFTLLLLLSILADSILLISLPPEKKEKITLADFIETGKSCQDCSQPDIYFLLFDEYAGSAALKQFWHFDNSGFDSALASRGFLINRESQSNYNFTPFSMASILNMSYLKGIKDVNACTVEDYSMCSNLILNNAVTAYLRNKGYSFSNYSIFDIKGAPSRVYQSFLPLKTRLITEQTLLNRMKKDLGYMLLTGPLQLKWLVKKQHYESLRNNNYFFEKTMEEAGQKNDKPRFIYTHFYMPHPPFYFDSSGKEREIKTVLEEMKTSPAGSYLQYLTYTNKKIIQLVDTLLQRSVHPPVIILMGDHGFRNCSANQGQGCFFGNLNAVYLPGKNYSGFYESISGVNQFRVIFNSLFRENITLLKDSVIFLTDKK